MRGLVIKNTGSWYTVKTDDGQLIESKIKGNFVIAFVDGEFTIKQFKMDESGTFGWLIPWNKNFSPIRVDETNRFMIWGVVTYVIHQIAE